MAKVYELTSRWRYGNITYAHVMSTPWKKQAEAKAKSVRADGRRARIRRTRNKAGKLEWSVYVN